MRREDWSTERLRRVVAEVAAEARSKDMFVYASAIAFRMLIATIPVALFIVALLGTVGLGEVWSEDVAPGLRENVSDAVYTVIDDAVRRVLGGGNAYWLTIGAVVALASLASVVVVVTRAITRLHEIEDSRGLVERVTNALLVGAGAGALLLAAAAAVRLGPLAFDALLGDSAVVAVLSFLVRWGLAVILLLVALIVLKRVAPDRERPLEDLAAGSALIVGGWIAMSLLFGLYLRYVARYGSIFGNLATAYVTMQYIALSAGVFVAGLIVDHLALDDGRKADRGP